MKFELGGTMQKKWAGIVLASSLALQGCATASNSLYGPQRPFQAGRVGSVTTCAQRAGENFLEDRFVDAVCNAVRIDSDSSSTAASKDASARAMLDASFSLTNARCTDYFAEKAGTQTIAKTARSSVAPLLALFTGILSIVNIKNDVNGAKRADWEKGLTLASTATLAGLSIYEENFLFSAENVDDVRTLTKHAMSEYRTSALSLKDQTFDTAVEYSLEYHMICTPGKIKSLVKKAIQDKKIEVVDRSSGQNPAAAGVAPTAAGATLDIQ